MPAKIFLFVFENSLLDLRDVSIVKISQSKGMQCMSSELRHDMTSLATSYHRYYAQLMFMAHFAAAQRSGLKALP